MRIKDLAIGDFFWVPEHPQWVSIYVFLGINHMGLGSARDIYDETRLGDISLDQSENVARAAWHTQQGTDPALGIGHWERLPA